MKQFLKLSAVFACVAFMFCACGDDGAEDVVSSSVLGSSEFRVLHPGEERAWVKWIVPENDKITNCELSWTSDVGVSGSYMYSAVTGVMETDQYSDLHNMKAGNYTFTIKNLGSGGVVSDLATTADLTIYDQDTYESREVPRPLPSTMIYDDLGAQILWSDIPNDCIGVTIYYYNTEVDWQVNTGLQPVSTDTPIIITDAISNEMFTYTTHFKPNEGELNEGLDEIVIANDDTQYWMFPSSSPSAPFGVSAAPGDGTILVSWSVPLVADITGTYIEYSNGVDKAKIEITGDDLKKGISYVNQTKFTGLAAGNYDVTVYNIKNTGSVSDSETLNLTVYDATTYTKGATIRQDITLNSSGQAEISWNYDNVTEGFEDCIGVVVTGAISGNVSVAGGTELERAEALEAANAGVANIWSYIDNATLGEGVTYTTYFRPEEGLDYIAVSNVLTDLTVASVASPSKPRDVTFIPGDKTLFFEFTLDVDTNISHVLIEYTNPDDASDWGKIEMPRTNLFFGDGNENFIGVSTTSEIAAGNGNAPALNSEYNIELKTVSYGGIESAYEYGERILVYDLEEFKIDCYLPSMSYDFGVAYPYGATISWANISDDIDYLDFTYVCDLDGNTNTVRLTRNDLTTAYAIADAMPGNAYSYVATFIPATNANNIYTLSAGAGDTQMTFPTIYVDKSLITEYSLYGDAAKTTADEGYTGFDQLFDDYAALTTTTTLSTVSRYQTAYGQKDMTLSYDLGATYALTEFFYTPYLGHVSDGFTNSSLSTNYTVVRFSLWGTASTDPDLDPALNRKNDDGTPILDEWVLLLDNVETPDLNESAYAALTDEYDYDGDGVVTADDMVTLLSSGVGFSFEIDDVTPVRYLRMQFHEAANQETVYASDTYIEERDIFLVMELDHKHAGVEFAD